MKKFKIFILFGALLAIPAVNYAQAFEDGTNLISLGFGLPPGQQLTSQYDQIPNHTDYSIKNYGTGVLKYEHGLHKYFGIGLNFEYSGSKAVYKYDNVSNTTYHYEVDINRSVIGGYLRMNGHYPIGEKLDFYGGVGLGYLYRLDNYVDTNPNANNTTNHKNTFLDFDYQITLGARFMVKKGFGLFAEIGKATTLCQVGIQLKF
ncbi:MAG TPA: outer membrane beta-barrel protein [Bacteroidia bacterium]|nr:outer membrane beta-barrel protein [Bacteroidia bacterium]